MKPSSKKSAEPVRRADSPVAPPNLASPMVDGDTSDMIRLMRAGIPARRVSTIAASMGLTQDKFFELLRLPTDTMKGLISSDGLLSSTEQDRIYRAERVLARAREVLEDEVAARSWISLENRALGGEVPLALLDTEVGYELVLNTLGRIAYGVVS
ncbi:MAG: antitoxin Xre/MbcA/ParS toxin-binding domain-containing protein [Pseudomonadota bacterium]